MQGVWWRNRKWCGAIIAGVLTLSGLAQASDEVVTATLPSGHGISAEFHQGKPGKHAVLVLHGFMTTRQFNTVQSIIDEVAGNGYTVLAPTLSLGVDNRRASIPCDAIHTHTWEADLQEVDFWVNWLVGRGYDSIVLVGHSTGSLHLVSYAANNPPAAVKKVVATSLVNIRRYTPDKIADTEIAAARSLRDGATFPLREYHLVFCNNYTSTPESYLSYIAWTPSRVLAALKTVSIPVEIIMGSKDRRFSSDWIDALKENGSKVVVIEGANHFFDSTYEFDLLDKILKCLSTTPEH